MKPKHLLYIPVALLAIGGSAFAYLYFRSPEIAPPRDIKVEMTQARIERGRYLYRLADCDGCHSERDFTRFGGPVVEAGRGRGGPMALVGLPGKIVVPNITPDPDTGLGRWTDGEKIRAIREGISRNGRVLFPLMPYPAFRQMSDNDVEALVAYLNTLPPVRNPLEVSHVDFPVSMFIKGVPKPAGTVRDRDLSKPEARGEYLALIGGCVECHTPMKRGQADNSLLYAGGRKMEFANFSVTSANITPDDETGIGKWDLARFQQKFRAYKDYAEHESPKVGPERFTLMPWLNLSRLPDEDLEALYAYLRTVPAIEHRVEKARM